MAFQLSPGVNISEIDLTNIVPAVDTSGAGFVGQFHWGPVMDYTTVSDKGRLEALFGKPSDVNFVDWYSAANFLAYSSNLNLIRVVDESDALNASADGLGSLIKNISHYDLVASSPLTSIFVAKYPGVLGNSIEVHIADSTSFDGWAYSDEFDGAPGTSPWAANRGATSANDELHVVVTDKDGAISGIPGAILERFAFVSKAKDAKTADGAPNFYGNIINIQSGYIWYTSAPASASYTPEGAVTSIAVTNGGAGYTSAPVVTISDSGTGAGAAATAVLSPTGEIVEITVTDGGTGYSVGDAIVISGNGTGATAEVDTESAGVITAIAITSGGSGYTSATVDASATGNGDATATATVGYSVATISVTSDGADYTSGTITTTVAAPDVGANTATIAATLAPVGNVWASNLTSSTSFKTLADNVTYSLSAGSDGSIVTSNELIAGWNMFSNAEVVDVSLLFVGDGGGQTSSGSVIRHVIDNICEKRKDVMVFFSPDKADVFNQTPEQATENVVAFRTTKINRPSSYAVMDSGWKYQYDVYNDTYRWIPLNADIAGLAARTDSTHAAWYSIAGYERGQIKNVVSLAFNPSKTSRDSLYKNNVNPVISEAGQGVLLYGDRTQNSKSAAFSKINIRRLFIVLEKSIAIAAKYQLFEFNDEFTRSAFRNLVEPSLVSVQSRRGIEDFRVVCDATNNGPEVVQRSEFVASIFIKPAYSINFIQLNFVAVRSDVEFSEVVGAV